MSKHVFGKWTFDDKKLTLTNRHYEVDLKKMDASEHVLDWIWQIHAKWPPETWDVQGFLDALAFACRHVYNNNPQSVFCPFGARKSGIKWKRRKKEESPGPLALPDG